MSEKQSIAELAKEFGITTRTIRFYEEQGLIKPERQGQRRVYYPRDKVHLKLIMRGKRLGFSLEEIRVLLNLYNVDPTDVTQLKLFITKLKDRKAKLRSQRDDIDLALAEIQERETQCKRLLTQLEEAVD